MNIALEQTEEYVNGVVTNRYGDAFIRGNNGHCLRHSVPTYRQLTDPPLSSSSVYFCCGGLVICALLELPW